MSERTHQSKLTVAVLAGGKSRRMGTDKSFVQFEGRPLIESVLDKVGDLGHELILITNKPADYAHLQLPMFSDVYPDHGSLGGIYTAVHYASHPSTLVIACDMPWLNRPLLQHMIALRDEADVIVPLWHDYPEPLHAIYAKACLAAIRSNLEAKRLKVIGFYGRVRVRFIEEDVIRRYDPRGRAFANINSLEDLRNLEE